MMTKITNRIFKTGQSSKLPVSQRLSIFGFLANLSFAWKMGLMAFAFFLGTLGISVSSYIGMQALRYHLSNIYDFMLVPIVTLSQANTAFADTEVHLNSLIALIDLGNANPAEIEEIIEQIEANEEVAYKSIDRYAIEWVTTVSPEFTQQLRDAGRLDLQEQEVSAVDHLTTAADEYEILQEEFYKSIDSGNPDETLLKTIFEKLGVAREHLQELIDINNQFAEISNQQAQEAYRKALLNGGIVLSIGLAFSLFVSYQIMVSITSRLSDLTRSAVNMQEGNLEQAVTVTGRDEVSLLGRTFNAMAEQLKGLFGTLEHRVQERTRNLELAAEVGRSISQVRDLTIMLKDACELILNEFDLYYVQVYLANSNQTELVLEAGTGAVGAELLSRGHRLPLNTGSINGRAAVEKRTVVIADTSLSATFRPNPLLPDTQGEMAVPLLVADKVVGVLDMQSRHAGTLNDEVLPAFEALAGQLAVAIQNANLLKETQQARAEVEAQARRLVRGGWNQHLDAIHKPEQIGFIFDRKEVLPFYETDGTGIQEDERAISAPIAITGEELGSLVVEIEDEARNEQTGELVSIVARQVAQQIENLRLLESAERYRYEAEQAARRQTLEGWQDYIESRTADSLGYMYDLNEVRPYSNGQGDPADLVLPLKARDEMVGKLAVTGVTPDDSYSIELANAVAERLSAHIESLRLFEETKHGQMELDKRAQQLAAVAEVSTASAQELDVQKMLATVVHLTQRQFNLYHAHVFTYRDDIETLQIVACGWKEGDEHEGTHGTTAIPIAQEQSLVARAARTRQVVVVNDVRNEPGWMPNPLLPDTQSEMAVPLLIGDRLLGVLDVQKDYLNAFTQEDVNINTTLASQVAIAMQNAYSFAQAQKQAEREAMLNTINQKIQSATSVEAVLQIAARELGHALGAPMTIAQLSVKGQN